MVLGRILVKVVGSFVGGRTNIVGNGGRDRGPSVTRRQRCQNERDLYSLFMSGCGTPEDTDQRK